MKEKQKKKNKKTEAKKEEEAAPAAPAAEGKTTQHVNITPLVLCIQFCTIPLNIFIYKSLMR